MPYWKPSDRQKKVILLMDENRMLFYQRRSTGTFIWIETPSEEAIDPQTFNSLKKRGYIRYHSTATLEVKPFIHKYTLTFSGIKLAMRIRRDNDKRRNV